MGLRIYSMSGRGGERQPPGVKNSTRGEFLRRQSGSQNSVWTHGDSTQPKGHLGPRKTRPLEAEMGNIQEAPAQKALP